MKTAIAIYIPVIHQGYLNFLNNYPNVDIFLIWEDIILDLVKKNHEAVKSVERDQRRLGSNFVLEMLSHTFPNRKVKKLQISDLAEVQKKEIVIMPNDSFHRAFKNSYAGISQDYQLVNYFLRWDRIATLNKDCDMANATITVSELSSLGLIDYVNLAKSVAMESPDWWRQVGAVLIKRNEEILTYYNKHLPTEYESSFAGDPRANFDGGEHIDKSIAIHAEAGLIAEAARNGISIEGCELFVTTFPCPTCAASIAVSGIKRVYYVDGYSLVNAAKILNDAGVELIQIVK